MKILKAFLLLVLIATSANAAELYNIYQVESVPISGETREAAIDDGQKKAMDILQDRLKTGGYIKNFRAVSQLQLNNTIDAIEIKDEKILTKSYKAKLNVIFSPPAVSRLFGINFIKQTPKPDVYLLVPILSDESGTSIWRHKWWDIFQKVKGKNFILPIGDLDDVRSLTREDYAIRDFTNLLKLQEKYDTTAILIAVAEYIPAENSVALNVETIKGDQTKRYNYDVVGLGKNTESEVFAQAANQLLKRINRNDFEGSLDDDNTSLLEPSPNTPPAINKSVEIEDPEEEPVQELAPSELIKTDFFVTAPDLLAWSRIRTKIMRISLVRNLKIKSFTAGRAFITIEHESDFQGLIALLEDQGLHAAKTGQYWEITERK